MIRAREKHACCTVLHAYACTQLNAVHIWKYMQKQTDFTGLINKFIWKKNGHGHISWTSSLVPDGAWMDGHTARLQDMCSRSLRTLQWSKRCLLLNVQEVFEHFITSICVTKQYLRAKRFDNCDIWLLHWRYFRHASTCWSTYSNNIENEIRDAFYETFKKSPNTSMK